jgi:hypothetical protein
MVVTLNLISNYNSSGCCLVASSNKSAKRTVDRYLSPNEGMITTIFFPLVSGLLPTSNAALTAAPDDIPHNTP